MTTADLAIINARVFDGLSDQLSAPSTILIKNGDIAAVSKDSNGSEAADVLDADGMTVMPGLIDAHFHAYAASQNVPHLETLPVSYLAHHASRFLTAALKRGFTTVRDAGGADHGLWLATQQDLFPSPRLFFSGRALSQTGGHGDSRAAHLEPCGCALRANLSQVVDGVDAVRKAAREELRRGSHQIKIFVSGGVVSPTDPIWMRQFSEEEIRAAVEEAESRRTYVMAHAYTAEAIERAVKCGVRSIEHGNLLSADTAAIMASHGAFLVPTLVAYEALHGSGEGVGLSQDTMAKVTEVRTGGRKAIQLCRDASVRVGFGTDLLGDWHHRQLEEFMIRAQDEAPLDILRSATSVNAGLLQQAGKLGCVKPGAHADLLLVAGNPLKDIGLIGEKGHGIAAIIKAGEIIRQPN